MTLTTTKFLLIYLPANILGTRMIEHIRSGSETRRTLCGKVIEEACADALAFASGQICGTCQKQKEEIREQERIEIAKLRAWNRAGANAESIAADAEDSAAE